MLIDTPSPAPAVDVVDTRAGALVYDPILWTGERLGMAKRRRALLSHAKGAVLEIGAGTGLSLRQYPEGLDELVLAEPAVHMAARIDTDRAPAGLDVRVEHAPAEHLPFPDASFDTVVSMLVLCTVRDPHRAVDEIVRVLRPGGQLLFLEHVRAEAGLRAALQRRAAGPWEKFAAGCRCDRPTLQTIEGRLRLAWVESGRWRGMPSIVKPLVWGRAVA